MKLLDRALLLKKSALFHTLDLDLLLPIADKTEPLLFRPGEKIFSRGQPANSLYLIVSGSIAIDVQAIELSVGDFFGDESLFNGRTREYTATAVQTTELLSLSRTNLMTIVSECPTVALSLLEAYATPISYRER